jgi:hypothetical protein
MLNQKFGMCEALCRVGAWSHVQKMFARLPESCLMSQPSIALALCEFLHIMIEPLYRRYVLQLGTNYYLADAIFLSPAIWEVSQEWQSARKVA